MDVSRIQRRLWSMDDEGNEIPLEKLPIARKTIIFMLSGINKRFQFPFAYHFVDALKANYLAELVIDVIIQVSKCGVKISNLTARRVASIPSISIISIFA